MKRVIGNKKIIIGILIVIIIIVAVVLKLNWKYEYYDEASVLKYYIEGFSKPEEVKVLALEKYEVSDEYTYYYAKIFYAPVSETENHELLLILNNTSRVVKMANFKDMEAGYRDAEKAVWEDISQEGPDESFSQDVIDEIVEVVLTK